MNNYYEILDLIYFYEYNGFDLKKLYIPKYLY